MRDAACTCGHPLSDHQTPGAECVHSALDCGCVTFRKGSAATRVRWLGSRRASRRDLRAALRFWVDRAERFEDALPADHAYLKARGVLSNHYTLGKAVRDADA